MDFAITENGGAKMRLIDEDTLFTEFESAAWYCNMDRDEIAERILLQTPTVDPVHAAGGCYCWECKNGKEWENRNGITAFKCTLLCVDISPEAFCSYGRREESRCEKD